MPAPKPPRNALLVQSDGTFSDADLPDFVAGPPGPNPDQLKILQQGVETWNIWRNFNRDIIPDLREAANLSKAALYCANLNTADLYKAKPHGREPRRSEPPGGAS
jgi:hypothetical protein